MSVPSEPQIYIAPGVFNQAIEFYWQPPINDGGSNITSYILESSNIGYISVLPPNHRKARVANLINQTDYLFTLKATNDFGNSNVATYRSVQPGIAPERPSNLNVSIDFANAEPLLNFLLTQPDTTNSSNITYNALTMYPLDNTGNIINNSPFMFERYYLPGQFDSVTLNDINTNYDYRGLIQVVNDVRWSKYDTFFNFKINPNLPTGNLKLWLDPYDTNTLTISSNKVVQWNDKSLNGSNANVNLNFAPTYDSANALLSFNGFQYMNLPLNTLPSGNSQYTMFIYASTSNISLSNLWLLYSGTPTSNLSLGAKINNGNIMQSWFGTDISSNLANFTLTSGLPILSEFTYDGSIRRTYVNGTLIHSEIANNRTSTTANNIIGSSSLYNSNLIGSIGDIIIYDKILSNKERILIENYLINKRSELSLRNYGNLRVWLDANDNNTLYNSNINEKISYHNPVSVWLDKSNNNNHALQSNLAIAPLKKSTFGKDYLNFNSGYMISNIATLPFDAFLVVQLNNLSNINDVIGISPESNNYNSLSYNVSANRWSNDSTSNTFISSNSETSTGFVMMEWSLGNNNAYIRRNGSNIANITNFNWSLPNNSRLYIGNDNGVTFNNSLKGNIGEIIMFNRQLTDNQRFPIEGYLAWKWGIQSSLPSSHFFYSKPPSLFNISSGSSQTLTLLRPSDISGLTIWLDASDSSSINLSGSNVTQWNDKSGNNNNAIAGTATYPLFASNTLNGLSTIRLRNNNDYFLVNNNLTTTTYPSLCYFAIINVSSSQSYFQRGGILSTDTGGMFGRSLGITGGNYEHESYSNFTSLAPFTSGNWELVSLQFNSTNSTTFTLNGTSYTGTASGTGNNTTGFKIGSYNSDGSYSTYAANFDVAEILVYGSNLTVLQRQQIEGYLAWKWGLQSNLPSIHPYKNAPPYTISNTRSLTASDISGLQLWLDANDILGNSTVYSNSSPVITWFDKSGFNNNATGGVSPTYNSGNNGVFFNGSNTFLNLPNNTLPFNNSSYTYFVIFTPLVNNHSGGLIGGGSQITPQAFNLRGNGGNGIRQYWWFNDIETTTTYTLFNKTIYETWYTSGSTRNILLNFTGSNSDTPGARAQTNNNNFIGKTIVNEFGNYFIHEILTYNRSLAQNERQQIEGYLAWKWGLQSNLPAIHPFKNAPPYTSTSTTRSLTASDVSGLQFWLDATQITGLTNGQSITSWNDRSTNNYVGTIVGNPTYQINANSLPVVRFNGSSQYINYGNILNLGTNPISVYAVYKHNTTGTSAVFGKTSYRGNPSRWTIVRDSGSTIFLIETESTGINASYSDSLTTTQLTAGLWDRSTIKTYQNGTLVYNSALVSSSNLTNNDPFVVGAYPNSSGGFPPQNYMNGDICELLVYNSALSTATHQSIEGYLAWKWGLQSNLPSIHPYKNIAPYINSTTRSLVASDISGLFVWLDASDPLGNSTILSNGTNVTNWFDKSGNNKNGTASGTTGTFNSATNSIRLNNSTYTFPLPDSATNETIFIVFKTDATSYSFVVNSTNTGGRQIGPGTDLGITNFFAVASGGVSYGSMTGSNAFVPNQLMLGTYVNTNSSTFVSVDGGRVNGSTVSLNYSSNGNNTRIIGTNSNIHEFIAFNRSLSLFERQQIEGYLAWKWGLQSNLPSSHAFKNNSPTIS